MNTEISLPQMLLYTRRSTKKDQKDIPSIEAQEYAILHESQKPPTDFANNTYFPMTIIQQFSDVQSAYHLDKKRPEFNKMIKKLETGQYDGVAAWKCDRLTRNHNDANRLANLLHHKKIKYIYTTDRVFTQDDAYEFINRCNMAFKYSEDLSRNIKRGQRLKARKGKSPHSAPLGFLHKKTETPDDESNIYHDPERAPQIKYLFQNLIETHDSLAKMQQKAKQMGLTTKKGNILTENQLGKIFRNPFYYGEFRSGGELHKGLYEPLISKSEWLVVQKILNSKNNKTGQKHNFNYTGLIKCGECGSSITADFHKRTQKNGNYHEWINYHCTKKLNKKCTQKTISEPKLSEKIEDTIRMLKIPIRAHNLLMAELIKDQTLNIETIEKAIQQNKKILSEHENAISAAYDAILKNKLPEHILNKKIQEYQEIIDNTGQTLVQLQQSLNEHTNQDLEAKDFANRILSFLNKTGIDGKKLILKSIFAKLTLLDNQLTAIPRLPLYLSL